MPQIKCLIAPLRRLLQLRQLKEFIRPLIDTPRYCFTLSEEKGAIFYFRKKIKSLSVF